MDAIKNTVENTVEAVEHALGYTGVGKTVLITGASGFVAAHVLNSFLERGYHVRATVRSDSTAENVKQTHHKYAKQLSFAIVKDVAAPGAFDEAVKDVDGVRPPQLSNIYKMADR